MLIDRRRLLQAAAGSAAMALVGTDPGRGDMEDVIVEPKDNVRLGLFQHVPKKWELEHNFAAFLEGLETASAGGVELLITPECQLDGYAAPDKESTRKRLFGIAQDIEDSQYLNRVGREAKARRMSIVFGFTQKEGNKLYNAAGLWDSSGDLVGVYHKTHIQTHDKQYDPGMSLPVFESPWGPLGIMICADRRWPETARTLRLKGARLLLCPSYGLYHQANEWWMRTRSYENDCFLAFAHPKVGFVSDPQSGLVGKLENTDKGVLIVDVDLSIATWQTHLRDRRPDLYGPICSSKRT